MKSVHTALRVLETISAYDSVGVSELARVLAIPKSNVQRSLQTLHEAGWISPGRCGGQWTLAAKATVVGQRGGANRLRLAAEPVMFDLRSKTHETIHLMIPEDDAVVLIQRLDGNQPVRTFTVLGARSPIVATANGKATLAHLPNERVSVLIARGLTPYTDKTIVDPNELLAELQNIRQIGYAINRGENDADVAAVAAAILSDTIPIGSMSISLPVHRLTKDAIERFGPLIAKSAHKVSKALSPPRTR